MTLLELGSLPLKMCYNNNCIYQLPVLLAKHFFVRIVKLIVSS